MLLLKPKLSTQWGEWGTDVSSPIESPCCEVKIVGVLQQTPPLVIGYCHRCHQVVAEFDITENKTRVRIPV